MKDLVITSKALRREGFIALGCFIAAFCLNVGAVIGYGRPAIELLSQIGFVVVIAVVTYFLLWIVRLIVLAIKLLFFKKK